MDPDISLALFSELSHLRQNGWDLIQEPERFRMRARNGTLEPSRLPQLLKDEAWRIAQFVAYSHFVSISKNSDNSFTIVSTMASGDGFEIVVEIAR